MSLECSLAAALFTPEQISTNQQLRLFIMRTRPCTLYCPTCQFELEITAKLKFRGCV